jgi:hypothetical protein
MNINFLESEFRKEDSIKLTLLYYYPAAVRLKID